MLRLRTTDFTNTLGYKGGGGISPTKQFIHLDFDSFERNARAIRRLTDYVPSYLLPVEFLGKRAERDDVLEAFISSYSVSDKILRRLFYNVLC